MEWQRTLEGLTPTSFRFCSGVLAAGGPRPFCEFWQLYWRKTFAVKVAHTSRGVLGRDGEQTLCDGSDRSSALLGKRRPRANKLFTDGIWSEES